MEIRTEFRGDDKEKLRRQVEQLRWSVLVLGIGDAEFRRSNRRHPYGSHTMEDAAGIVAMLLARYQRKGEVEISNEMRRQERPDRRGMIGDWRLVYMLIRT